MRKKNKNAASSGGGPKETAQKQQLKITPSGPISPQKTVVDKYDQGTVPTMAPVIVENIPQELKGTPNWLNWRWEWKGKWTKPPVNGTSTNATLTFAQALKNHKESLKKGSGAALGLGISLNNNDLCGIDLDSVLDGSGQVVKKIRKALMPFKDIYTEISPSGTGLRIFGYGAPKTIGASKDSPLEIYHKGRYLTVTGNRINDAAKGIADITKKANRLAAALKEPGKISKRPGGLPLGFMTEISSIPSTNRAEWLKVGMAIHFETNASDEGFRFWEKWSMSTYPEGETGCEKSWASFGKYEGEPITRATIQYLVKEITGGTDGEELKRVRMEYGSLSKAVQKVIEQLGDEVTYQQVCIELVVRESSTRNEIRNIFSRLETKGIIVKKSNSWKKVKKTGKGIDLMTDTQNKEVKIPLPFDLADYCVIRRGTTTLVVGDTNAGKTGMALYMCWLIVAGKVKNPYPKQKIRYLNSEMEVSELKARLGMFKDTTLEQWMQHVTFIENPGTLEDEIDPDALNIIDYLEVHDDFFLTGKKVADIDNALKSGIAVILIQKKMGQELPKGGAMVKEKARLVINLNYHDGGATSVKISKLKEPRNYKFKRQGQSAFFEINENGIPELKGEWEWIKNLERKTAEN